MMRCLRCGRPLRAPSSVSRKLGPTCLRLVGGNRFADLAALPPPRLEEMARDLERGAETDLGVWTWAEERDGQVLLGSARISVRFRAGAYEAYCRRRALGLPSGLRDLPADQVLARSGDLREVLRAAVAAGPEMEAHKQRLVRKWGWGR